MAEVTTAERILDAAEALFVEHGFAETSMRAITQRAGVNLAAVNYHFGSKSALIQSVFSRHFDPFAELFQTTLAQWAERTPTLEELVDALMYCALNTPSSHGDLRVFMKLIGLAYTQQQGDLRAYVQTHYAVLFERFMSLMAKATPELDSQERFWRLHFLLGSVVFTLSSLDTLRGMTAPNASQASIRALAQTIRPMAIAALRA
ncbi:TetR/AcrR family transcriptional regulator [Larsenimonas salina]|uniref:TetR/AcrR family transcriptional regulator n=1 Tax=Larsenimonas salina TaxID=1295565 RepID=UPI0020731692|nr:TetR/AcrR family transcriptional regulator [Larsenimonas salina]MCM5703188.1 TetR family transcriptional regulator [Larsenimonas salina]